MRIDFLRKGALLAVSAWCAVGSVVATPPSNLDGWDLVFSDEFDGSSLDKSKWNSTYNWGHTHNHRAYCVEENVSVEDGCLVIKGESRRHPDAPASCSNGGKTYSLDYTSGAIDTRGKFDVKYGYIEGRFKMPSQLGTWPAFWMLQDGWPPEIDIFEVPHARTDHHYYLHYTKTDWYAGHGSAWDHEASFGGVHSGPDKSADFHNYGLEWTATDMNFYFDDKLVASYNRPSEISQTEAMSIIVNLAIGGWATDNSNPIQVTASDPALLKCDWIRVWNRREPSLTTDTVRILSLDANLCLQASGNGIILGDCSSPSALATLSDLGNGAYRVNFGEKVLEIPNESKAAGGAVGLWGWNGKLHQQVRLAAQPDFDGLVVSMQFVHSGLFVRNTTGGDVVQEALPQKDETAYWQLLPGATEHTDIEFSREEAPRLFYDKAGLLKVYSDQVGGFVWLRLYSASGVLLQEHGMEAEPYVEIPVSLVGGLYLVQFESAYASVSLKLMVY
ncbi:MAG: glycoside hydrolase family 16 protein [Paludibacteraceae bacterium]